MDDVVAKVKVAFLKALEATDCGDGVYLIDGYYSPSELDKATSDAIAAYRDALAEAGFVVVPREPTKEMNEAGNLPYRWNRSTVPPRLEIPFAYTSADAWRAMVDAAPKPPGSAKP